MYEHVKTGCKHILHSEQPLQFQSGYYLNKPRILHLVDGFVILTAYRFLTCKFHKLSYLSVSINIDAFHCIALYCIALYCIALYCNCIALH